MGRSQEHNDRISEAILHRYQDDPAYAEMLSQSARRRWVREYNDEVNAVLDECEAGRLQRNLLIGLRAMKRILEDGQQLDDPQRKLIRALRVLNQNVGKSASGHIITLPRKDDPMKDAASTPYVSETQTRHPPTTTRHQHDHAAYDATDHDDGLHSHEHEHHNDSTHDHVHDHPRPGGERRPVGADSAVAASARDGIVGRQMNAIGPLERKRLKDEQIRAQEARNRGLL